MSTPTQHTRPQNTGQAPAIRVRDLERSFGDLHVLRGVDFDVAQGSIFALLGSNGAGKTTLVRILTTLARADAGTATVAGFDVATHAADVRASISLTGQFAAVDDVLTGADFKAIEAALGGGTPGGEGDVAINGEAIGVTLYLPDGNLRPLEEIEADVIRLAIGHYRGRMTEVARRLGIGRSTLYRKLSDLWIDTAA